MPSLLNNNKNTHMTPRDYENLRFLLTISAEELEGWYRQASFEDIVYASSLFNIGHLEFIDFAVELMDDYPQAKEIIDKVRG